jgi:hypothetical protein
MRHKLMKTSALALVLCVAAMVTVACSDQPMSVHEVGASNTSTAQGRLTGRLVTVGGPAPGAAHPVGGKVTVAGRGVDIDVEVGQDGAYAVNVPVGRYKVTGQSPSVEVNDRETRCRSLKDAQVTSGAVAVLDAICPIK